MGTTTLTPKYWKLCMLHTVMPVCGILFDIGDTLLAATLLQEQALREASHALEMAGLVPDSESLRLAYSSADQEAGFQDLPDLNHLYADPRVFERACGSLGWQNSDALTWEFLTIHRNQVRKCIRPNPEHIESIQRLASRGFRLGVVSNGTTVEQQEQLRLLELDQFFSPIVVSQQAGIRKPTPAIFHLAIRDWGIPASQILMVGDRPDIDILGAKRAGMKAALTWEFVSHPTEMIPVLPDCLVASIAELARRLEALP